MKRPASHRHTYGRAGRTGRPGSLAKLAKLASGEHSRTDVGVARLRVQRLFALCRTTTRGMHERQEDAHALSAERMQRAPFWVVLRVRVSRGFEGSWAAGSLRS